MNTPQGTQEVAHRGPHPFSRVDMHFADVISIIVTRPLLGTVADGGMRPDDVLVALPLIREYYGLCQSKAMHMRHQGSCVGVRNYTQADLATLPPDRADDGRPIVIVGAVSAPFVSSSAGGIVGISVTFPFFPPHSETSRPFQFARRAKHRQVEAFLPWLGGPCAARAPSGAITRSRELSLPSVRPCICRVTAEWPALTASAFPRTPSHCTHCRCLDKRTGRRSSGSSWLRGTHVPPSRFFRSVGTLTRSGESTSTAKPHSDRRQIGLRLESPC